MAVDDASIETYLLQRVLSPQALFRWRITATVERLELFP
jgi:hypothetical protein